MYLTVIVPLFALDPMLRADKMIQGLCHSLGFRGHIVYHALSFFFHFPAVFQAALPTVPPSGSLSTLLETSVP